MITLRVNDDRLRRMIIRATREMKGKFTLKRKLSIKFQKRIPDTKLSGYREYQCVGAKLPARPCSKYEISIEMARSAERAGVTERTTSLHSGSSDSVQNPEAELRDFEARKRELKLAH